VNLWGLVDGYKRGLKPGFWLGTGDPPEGTAFALVVHPPKAVASGVSPAVRVAATVEDRAWRRIDRALPVSDYPVHFQPHGPGLAPVALPARVPTDATVAAAMRAPHLQHALELRHSYSGQKWHAGDWARHWRTPRQPFAEMD
jgi:hypothetical protein